MQIDDELLQKLEKLSFLKIDNSKREETISQLSEILHFVENLNALDTQGVEQSFSMTPNATPLRQDTINSSTEISTNILKNAPKSGDNFFIVPKIIE